MGSKMERKSVRPITIEADGVLVTNMGLITKKFTLFWVVGWKNDEEFAISVLVAVELLIYK